MKKVFSVCPLCGVGCGIELVVERGKVLKVLPYKGHPVSKGKLCVKGYYLHEFINSKERLKYPLIKKNGKFKKASWDEALDFVAKRLMEIRDTYGKNSIGFIASTKCTNEENYLFQKFARIVVGTNNIDNATRLCHAPTVYGMYEILGRSAMTNSYEDLATSECILIFGNNPAFTQPIAFSWIMKCKENGGKIITVDVRETETSRKSDIFVRINPNTDLPFVAGLIKVILEEGLEDKKFIRSRTRGYKEFLKSLEKFDLKEISKITGVKEERIREIAKIYGEARNAAIVFGMGITQHQNGLANVLALTDLALLTGNFGKWGSGVNPLRGCNNVQGAADMGCLPNVYPGYASLKEITIERFGKLWGVKDLPISKGLTEVEMIESIPERILALYIIGSNLLLSFSNVNKVEKELKSLEFLVVQDIFMTETAKLADVVLPAACFAEKTGTFTNSERRVQLIEKAVEPPGKAKEDWIIIQLLAQRMEFKEQFNFKSTREIFREIRKAIPMYSGITYKKLGRKGIQWPCHERHPHGKKFLFDKDFGLKGSKATFYPLSYTPSEIFDHVYPFRLIPCRILEHFNTGTLTRRMKDLEKLKPEPWVEISEKDAKKLKIKEGKMVKLISPFGEIEVKAIISGDVEEGIVVVPNHYTEARVNKLTSNLLDPISKIPSFKYCGVKIEKVR